MRRLGRPIDSFSSPWRATTCAHQLADAAVVGGAERQEANLLEARVSHNRVDRRQHLGQRALAHRAEDHAGLAEAAAAGAAALDLDRRPVVDDVDERHDEIGWAAAAGSGRCACSIGSRGHVCVLRTGPAICTGHRSCSGPRRRRARRRRRSAARRRSASARLRPARRASVQARTISAIASSPSPTKNASKKACIGSGLRQAEPPARISGHVVRALGRAQRDAGQVERGQDVGVELLVRQARSRSRRTRAAGAGSPG